MSVQKPPRISRSRRQPSQESVAAAVRPESGGSTRELSLPPVAATDLPGLSVSTISIPETDRSRRLEEFKPSVRLGKIFMRNQMTVLGDLHGLLMRDFRRLAGCGRKSSVELQHLVHSAGGTLVVEQRPASPRKTPAGAPLRALSVPPHLHAINAFDLPLSHRAENVLRKIGVRQLGDLDGINPQQLLAISACGQGTIREIQRLLAKARTGAYLLQTDKELSRSALLEYLDSLLLHLRSRENEFIQLRFGSEPDTIHTLQAVADRFGITRERVRQVVQSGLQRISRRGGLRLKRALDRLAKNYSSPKNVLTPERLAAGTPSPWPFRHDAIFFLHLLAALRPGIVTQVPDRVKVTVWTRNQPPELH